METDPPTDPRDRVIEYAAEVLRQHVPDGVGWCLGCIELWDRLVFIDQCQQVRWATAVHTAYAMPIGQAPQGNGSTDVTGEARGGEGS